MKTWLWGLLFVLLATGALPPWGMWGLVFLAPVPLVWWILEPERPRGTFAKAWCTGFVFWLFQCHFVRYPHPINYGLWILLSAYLGLYLPLFIEVSRVWIHQILQRYPSRWTVLAVVPMVWGGGDILRCWILTGYPMSSLCHALYRVPLLIQTADWVGEWGTTATILLAASCLAVCVSRKEGKLQWHGEIFGVLAVLAAVVGGYGQYQLHHPLSPPEGKIALLQGDIPAQLSVTPDLIEKTEKEYLQLARQAISQESELDLLVFPESIYRHWVLMADEHPRQPPGLVDETGNPMEYALFQERLRQAVTVSHQNLLGFAEHLGVAVVTGCSVEDYSEDGLNSYNSAIYVPRGATEVEFCYHKMHLVPFGEYVPMLRSVLRWIPAAEQFSPIGAGGKMGEKPVLFMIPIGKEGKTLNASINICFESVIGRLIRRQIATLRQNGQEPDFLLNVTNNGWFGHSHETELHLACGVFRAVENRKPLLVAANYGISTSILASGQISQALPIGQSGILIAHVQKDSRQTLYTRFGWFFPWIPVLFLALSPIFSYSRR
ncbi:MAG: apolipoprotein N-acyltransferase [Planctomycetia bacterium]|nr:apolipoprotein N-acyltransferase [Planctomycetia bacterium]